MSNHSENYNYELEKYPVRVLIVDDEPLQRRLGKDILDDPIYEA